MRSTQLALFASLAAFSSQNEKGAMVDTTRPLVNMKDYVPPNDLDNVPDHFYPENYRILNCWECFQAQGKFCMDEGHNSLFHYIGSSDPGNGFCCKPDSNEGHCKHGSTHDYASEEGITTICSEPSYGASSKFESILSNNRNHQMFAFCPSINHEKCGVKGQTHSSTEMGLKAGVNKQHVEADHIRYKRPSLNDPTREYDACYYEITLDPSVLGDYNPKKLHIEISGKTAMNVFIYGGQNRFEATESLIQDNAQASAGQTYSIGVDKGFLVVAYPEEGVLDTEFGFNYWVEAVLKSEEAAANETNKEDESTAVEIKDNENVKQQLVIGQPEENTHSQTDTVEVKYTQGQTTSELDEMMFYGLCAGAVVLLLAIIVVCYKCRSKGKITTASSQDLGYGSGNNSNERSLHVESMGDDETNRDAESNKEQGKMSSKNPEFV